MYSFLIFTTVVFPYFTTSASGKDTCVNDSGTNATCHAACLKQPCSDTGWSCDGTLLSTCTQSCYDNSCTQLACNKLARKCDQYCFGCQNMNCSSLKCLQHCTSGYCRNIMCSKADDCQQLCNFCRRQRCYETKSCLQQCLDSDCSLECLQSQACQQHCHGDGCKANCLGNINCRQICHPKANCTHLVCESKLCSQNCANNSMCRLLRCHGDLCRQDSYVEKSKLECSSNICNEQVSHVSNTDLSCDNINGSCVQKCYGSGCIMSCGEKVKSCRQYCYGGNCNMSCARGSDTCSMDCPGGNCVLSCKAKNCLLLCKHGCKEATNDNTEDTREECDNSGNKLSFHPVLFLIFTSFKSLF